MSAEDWPEKYQLALSETDDKQLPRRISEARQAIIDRMKQVPANSTERLRMDIALEILRLLFELFLLREDPRPGPTRD